MKRFIVTTNAPGFGIRKHWYNERPMYELILSKPKYVGITDKSVYQKITQLKD